MNKNFIGNIAKKTGMNPRTIRFYESIGLLPKPIRSESGYRVYPTEIIDRLDFIKKAKTLGLKLSEIKEIIELYDRGEVPCPCTRDFLNNKILELDEQIKNLKSLRKKLATLLQIEIEAKEKGICPIIDKS